MKAKKLPTEMRGIDSIFPYEGNVKNHDAKQVAKIAASISKFGWLGNPIVVNAEGVILAGHGRRLAAISSGLTEVPVQVISDLSLEAQRAYRLADNRVAISDIDSELLQQELGSLDFDMDGIFDQKELDFLVADLGTMKVEAFISDMDEVVANQSAETSTKIAEADGKDIRLDKAFGFKSFKGRDERHVVRFMAELEESTGLTGADAFVSFIKLIAKGAGQPAAA